MNDVLHKYKWFWAWQDEKEEAWLKEMAHTGYHLAKVDLFGSYTFRPGSPKEVVYRLDYQDSNHKDKQSYLQLFQDADWEHVGEMSGWQYFRKEIVDGEEPEIYTDPASKAEKYGRLMGFLTAFLPILVVVCTTTFDRVSGSAFWLGFEIIYILLMIFYTIALVNLWSRYDSLKKQKI